MKTDFEKRLQNDLFPEPPASFSRKVLKPLQNEGVKKKTVHPWRIAATAIALSATAAALVLVVWAALRTGGRKPTPLTSADPTATETEQPIAQATDAPWNTTVFALAPESDDIHLPLTQQQAARAILDFQKACGESEPEELWILGMRVFDVPRNAVKDYFPCALILAQSDFGDDGWSDWGGSQLYCFSLSDGSILWGTDGVSNGPMQTAVEMEGQTWHFLYGANVPIAEPGSTYVDRGLIVGSEPGTDVEFSMFRPHSEMAELLRDSHHLGCLNEYFFVRVSESDWENGVKNRILRFETLECPYDADIATQVPVVGIITNADAARLKEAHAAAGNATPTPYAGQVVRNLTTLADEESARYTDAILRALQLFGVEPDELWLCAVAEPALDPDPDVQNTEWRDESADRKYLLAQYEFEGECGPELFDYYDNRVQWMTQGYEPYALNLVHDSPNGQTIVFGASCAFDGKPLSMAEAHLLTDDADYNKIGFLSALPLAQVQLRVADSRHADAARDFYLVPLKGDKTVLSLSITAYGKDYAPYEPVNDLTPPIEAPYMAIVTDGRTLPGTFTHFVYATEYTEHGVLNADGYPVLQTLTDYQTSQIDPTVMPSFSVDTDWRILPGDGVTVKGVRVYTEQLELLSDVTDIDQLSALPAGNYYVGFECRWTGSPIPGNNGFRNRMELAFYRIGKES